MTFGHLTSEVLQLGEAWNHKRIFVAGASGFIGSNLAAYLAKCGARVRGSYFTRLENVPKVDGLDVINLDLTKRENCDRAVEGCEAVFMCAAVTSGAAVIRGDPLSHVLPNILMNTQLLDAAHDAGVKKVIFLSTGCVYPEAGNRRLKEEEAFIGPPADVYFAAGWMKRYSETLCRLYSKEMSGHMGCVVVRPSNVYGPGDKFGRKTSHVAAAQIRNVFEKISPIEIWGDGTQVRDLIYIGDFIEGLVRASVVDDAYFEVNIASGCNYAINKIVETATQVAGYTPKIRWDDKKPTTVDVLQFDIGRARNRLGFECRISLSDGIRKTLDWLEATPKRIWER